MGGKWNPYEYDQLLEVEISLPEAALQDINDTMNAVEYAARQAIRELPATALRGFRSMKISIRSRGTVAEK